MIMSERDSVHKEIEKLQEEVSLLIDFNKDFNFIKTNDTSNKALI